MLTLDQVKLKSLPRLSGLHPVLVAATVALIERCYTRGVNIVITQGFRSKAEQDALYAQGRTKPGSIVTNAKGGTSNHNHGLAIDFGLLLPDGRTVSWDTLRDGDKDSLPDWSEVVEEAKKLGLSWGGDWRSFKDMPHFDMTFGLSIAQLRAGKQPSAGKVAAAYAVIDKLQGGAKIVKKDVKVTVNVNGKKIQDGVLDDGVTYLPVRAVAEALGLTVGWDQPSKTVTLTKGGK
ncbi:M15 family metallopeptidase [Paenibacillus sp. FSL H8-0122]|uniref:M15 family metallopeptidase n=1 Tax=Paenibacillus sp. FSL H8-0122 TaxID=2954510 RepID=UPI0030F66694